MSCLTNGQPIMKNFYLSILLLFSFFASAGVDKTYTPNEIKADFRQLYTGLENASYDLYARTPKSFFESEFNAWLTSINGPVTHLEAHKQFMCFTALANIAHTKIEYPIDLLMAHLSNGGKLLPISISLKENSVFVGDYYGVSESVAVGDEILTVNGVDAYSWVQQLQQYIAADNTFLANTALEEGFAPYVWLHEGELSNYKMTLRRAADNTLYELQQPTLALEQHSSGLKQSNQQPESKPREFKVIGDVGYLKPGPFYNIDTDAGNDTWNNETFEQFIDKAFTLFIEKNVDSVVIDLRNNPGGSSTFSDLMIAWFADKPFKFASDFKVKVSQLSRKANAERMANSSNPSALNKQLETFYERYNNGEIASFPLELSQPNKKEKSIAHLPVAVYALVDKSSFSNAVSVAAIIQDYDFGTILGEETADLATTYASMEHFTLDNTGIRVGYPKAHIIRPNGNKEPRGVVPDHPVSSLEQALSFIRSQ